MSSTASDVAPRPLLRRSPRSDDRNRSDLFPGPVPFTENQKALFFGREREVFDLMAVIHAQRVLLVHGASGTGKTSLLQAGVAPEARMAGFDVLPAARVRDVEGLGQAGVAEPAPIGSGNCYVDNMLRNWQVSGVDPSPASKGVSLAGFLAARQSENSEQRGRILILDQFEELFTAHPERWPERGELFSQLQAALDADGGLRVVFLIRDDYLAQIEHYAPLLRDRLSTRYHLRGLREADAFKAVVGPFRKAEPSQEFAPGVADTLVKSLFQVPSQQKGSPSYREEFVEPVHLQIVCLALSERVVGVSEITDAHLKAYADVKVVLADFYEQAIRDALKGQRRVSERRLRLWVEQKLIISGHTRAPLYQDPDKKKTAGMDNNVVDALEQSRLLRSELRGGGSRWVELTHDRFIEPVIKSNRDWIAKHFRPWFWTAGLVGAVFSLLVGSALGYFSNDESFVELQSCDRVDQLRAGMPGSDCRFFDAGQGQMITAVLSTPESRDQAIELLGPQGDVVRSVSSRAPILVHRVTDPGDYVVRAAAGPAGGNYHLRATLQTVDAKRRPIQPGSPVDGSISQPDRANLHTFEGRKGAVAVLEMTGNRIDSRLTLVAPNGQVFVEDGRLTDQLRAGVHLLASLPDDGTYEVWASSAGTTGSYRLSLAFPPTRPLVADATLTGWLDYPGSMSLYTLTAPPSLAPGSVAVVTVTPRSDLDVRLRLLAPDSFLLADRDQRKEVGDMEAFAHPVAQGVTYLVAVSSPADRQRAGTFQLSVDYRRPTPLADKATATLRARDQVDVFDFQGAKGEVATVVVTPMDALDSLVDVYAPDGTTLLFKDETVSGQEELFAVRLPGAGTYVVTVSGYSGQSAVGAYELALTRSAGSR